ELRRYLSDIVRQGLVGVQSQPGRYWEEMAARLVDAQAPGLARRVRELGETAGAGTDWHSRFVRQLARLYLAAAGYERQEQLSPELRAALRTEIGWTQSREELAELPGEPGTWCVVSQRVTEEDRLTVQRTWLLRQEDARFALLLEFAPAGQPLGSSLMV